MFLAAGVLKKCVIDYEPRLHAYGSTLLRTAPSRGAVTGLSYPLTPCFQRCRLRQVSPCSPRTSPCAQKPSRAAVVTLFRHVPTASLNSLSLCSRSPGHCLPSAVSASPNLIDQIVRSIGSKGRVSLPSALRNAASLITGTALQRLLVKSNWRSTSLSGWRPD